MTGVEAKRRVAAANGSRASAGRGKSQGMKTNDMDAMVLIPARKEPSNNRMTDQVYRRLRRAIITNEIPARTRLIELELAEALGASRTPIREAILRLTSDHLVTPLVHGGVEVVDTQRELDDIYCIREALEGKAARLAAERIDATELARLDALIKETRHTELGDYKTRVRINNDFHDIITRASRSVRLIQMVESYREYFLSEGKLQKYGTRDRERALLDHVEIVEALRRHDGRRAEKVVCRHLESDRRRMLKVTNR